MLYYLYIAFCDLFLFLLILSAFVFTKKDDFQTGAMKVTPAHDFLDFEIGKRHNLPITPVIDSDGNIIYETATLSKRSDFVFIKRGRFDARSAVLTFMLQSDLYRFVTFLVLSLYAETIYLVNMVMVVIS